MRIKKAICLDDIREGQEANHNIYIIHIDMCIDTLFSNMFPYFMLYEVNSSTLWTIENMFMYTKFIQKYVYVSVFSGKYKYH